MVHSINTIKEKAIPLSITQAALRTARQFANLQPTQTKKQQVYFNTLAVCVVNDYMQMMEIPTELNASDSWNQALRLAADVADLMLPGLGHLECRPVRPESLQHSATQNCYIPPEVPSDRIGIVVVSIDQVSQQATLLGFTKTVETTSLAISQLQTIDDLLEYLEYGIFASELPPEPSIVARLSQWLQKRFETGWQSVESVLNTQTVELALNFREAVTTASRAKPIDLGSQLMAQSVVLVVKVTPTSAAEMEILVGVQPGNGQTYLPAELQLAVLDKVGASVMVAIAKSANKNIQLQFSGEREEKFSVKVTLGDVSVIENFVI